MKEETKVNSNINLRFLMSYSLSEISRRKCYFCLCLTSCFIASLVALISNTVLNQGPIIFVMIAQTNEGEIDATITPKPIKLPVFDILDEQIYYGMLNHSLYEEVTKGEKKNATSSSARLTIPAYGGNITNETELSLSLVAFDTLKENKSEIGRGYAYDPLKEGECIIHSSKAKKLRLKQNDTLYLSFKPETLVKNLVIHLYRDKYNQTRLHQLSNVTSFRSMINCSVVHLLNKTYGKFGKSDKDFVLMESEHFLTYISRSLNQSVLNLFPSLPVDIKNSEIKTLDLSNEILISFAKPRLNYYLASNYDKLQKDTTTYINKIVKKIGIDDHVNFKMPLVKQMKKLYKGAVFLGLILNLIIFILFLLSIVLIYSLLVITLETSSAELGILRLIGSSKKGIIVLVIIQCFLFSVPAYLLAFVLHFFVLKGVQIAMKEFTGAMITLEPDPGSIFISLALTNLAPLIAASFPIRSLVTRNLANSLNMNQSKTSGIKIAIVSASDNERSTLIIFGILTVIYGLSIYYFLPQALLSEDMGLLLGIFMWILLGMLLGFILLSLNIEHLMQKACNFLLFFWSANYKKILILKNLSAHRLRNRKTSLMYALSVGFFIMINVGMNIEIQSMRLEEQKDNGAYFRLEYTYEGYLKASDFRTSMKKLLNDNLIEDYSFMTPSLPSAQSRLKSTWIQNMGKSLDYWVNVYGLSYNFYNTTINNFLSIADDDNLDLLISEKAYLQRYDGSIGISEYFRYEMGIELQDPFFLYLDDQNSNYEMRFIFKPSYMLDNSPVITMDYNPGSSSTRAMILPFHTYLNLLNKCYNFFYTKEDPHFQPFSLSLDEIPIKYVMLKLNKKWTEDEVEKIQEIVELDPYYLVKIYNYMESKEEIDETGDIINYMFTGVSFIVMIFCFFNLSSTMTINIWEQTKEIAVFRSLGLTKNDVMFVYMAEAIVLIFSSSIVGFIIGSILAFTMTIQRSLFTHLPISYIFPTTQFIMIIIVSALGGVFSTLFPARKLLKKEISDIIRN